MAKYKLEYIWLDGYTPVASLRGKTSIKEFKSFPKLEEVPEWGFDGSSTQQAEGHSSDCILKPVAIYPDSTKKNGAIVMCEVMLPDGKPIPPTPAPPSSTMRTPGSASSRSTSSTRTPPARLPGRGLSEAPGALLHRRRLQQCRRRRARAGRHPSRPLSRRGHQP